MKKLFLLIAFLCFANSFYAADQFQPGDRVEVDCAMWADIHGKSGTISATDDVEFNGGFFYVCYVLLDDSNIEEALQPHHLKPLNDVFALEG